MPFQVNAFLPCPSFNLGIVPQFERSGVHQGLFRAVPIEALVSPVPITSYDKDSKESLIILLLLHYDFSIIATLSHETRLIPFTSQILLVKTNV